MKFSIVCKICNQEMKAPNLEHTKGHMMEQLEKLKDSDPMQFYDAVLKEDWE